MKLRIVVLGAGFGGLELSTILSERIGDRIDLTLIDKNNSFYATGVFFEASEAISAEKEHFESFRRKRWF